MCSCPFCDATGCVKCIYVRISTINNSVRIFLIIFQTYINPEKMRNIHSTTGEIGKGVNDLTL